MKSKQDRDAMEKTQQQLFGYLENSWKKTRKILKKRTTYMNKKSFVQEKKSFYLGKKPIKKNLKNS